MVKRVMDATVAALLLVLWSPLIALLAALVWISCGRPVFFTQERSGKGGRSFTFYKFRTMRPGAPGESDAARLSRVGRWLRSLSLDELPQLFHVLTGEMSLVGPRPLLPQYLSRYTAKQARRHEVLPGITGLAQVSGRNALGWEEKFALDVWYVEHQSIGLDLWILWRTLLAVVRRDGVSARDHATMPEFLGSVERAPS